MQWTMDGKRKMIESKGNDRIEGKIVVACASASRFEFFAPDRPAGV
jgi:hypothetical protein